MFAGDKFVAIKVDKLDEQKGKKHMPKELLLNGLVVSVARVSYEWIVAEPNVSSREGFSVGLYVKNGLILFLIKTFKFFLSIFN